MGIFDSFLGDIQKEIRQATTIVNTVKSGAAKVVDAIDNVEDKVNNLPSEAEIKKKLKQSLKTTKPTEPKQNEELTS